MSDNMGGIISAEYCFVSELAFCAPLKHGILLALKNGETWKEFPSHIGNIEINITEETNIVHDLWVINGKIRCPRKSYETIMEMIMFRYNNKILLKYTTANGDVMVVGDFQYPIKISQKIIQGTTASDYSGVEFLLNGIQFHPQLALL